MAKESRFKFKPGDSVQMTAEGKRALSSRIKTGIVTAVYLINPVYVDIRRGKRVELWHVKWWELI